MYTKERPSAETKPNPNKRVSQQDFHGARLTPHPASDEAKARQADPFYGNEYEDPTDEAVAAQPEKKLEKHAEQVDAYTNWVTAFTMQRPRVALLCSAAMGVAVGDTVGFKVGLAVVAIVGGLVLLARQFKPNTKA